jgi:2-methylisocitrate lyase-like PEP mutase family enzyme
MSRPAELRALLARPGMLIAPGCYDCITARLVARAGFDAVYMTGAGTAATLGFPDYGLTTMTEMVDNAARIADTVELPLIADADTGFGNELNATRAVRAFEKAGVAGIHIEDQVFPKKCGHLDSKQVIPQADYIAKIAAAADARRDRDFVLIARTDARAPLGFEVAIERANRALEAGADIAFVEAPQTLEELEQVPRLVAGPCLLNVVHKGKTPAIDFATAERFGFRLAIVPGLLFATVLGAGAQALEELKQIGRHPVPASDTGPRERFRVMGSDDWDLISDRYAVEPD